MNPRFILLIFASSVIVFATVWAATAPRIPPVPTIAAAAPVEAVLYADCAAAQAAGAAPIRADQPGYRPALDGNMNGIACEPVGGAVAPTAQAATPGAAETTDTAGIDPNPTEPVAADPTAVSTSTAEDTPPPEPQSGKQPVIM